MRAPPTHSRCPLSCCAPSPARAPRTPRPAKTSESPGAERTLADAPIKALSPLSCRAPSPARARRTPQPVATSGSPGARRPAQSCTARATPCLHQRQSCLVGKSVLKGTQGRAQHKRRHATPTPWCQIVAYPRTCHCPPDKQTLHFCINLCIWAAVQVMPGVLNTAGSMTCYLLCSSFGALTLIQYPARTCPHAAQAPAHGVPELQDAHRRGRAGHRAGAHPRDLARAQHRALQRQRARRQRLHSSI